MDKNLDGEDVVAALADGKLVVVIMSKGHLHPADILLSYGVSPPKKKC